MKDFQSLPKIRDSISYIYIDHAVIEQQDSSIVINRKDSKIPIPVAATTCLMIGPGTSITHAAIKSATENGCMIVWCGDHGEKYYASGMGETRSAENLLLQAKLCMDSEKHLLVAKRMYKRRFPDLPEQEYTLQQLRGMEGIRMKQAYKLAAKQTGIKWNRRDYKTTSWEDSDPVNRALSTANSILYSICQAAIISLGYSPALGFVHTGKMLSFVYDIGDLYKADTTIPAAFEAVQRNPDECEEIVRALCRQRFNAIHLMKRIPEDIEWVFDVNDTEHRVEQATGDLWNEDGTTSSGGKNYGK